MRTGTVYTPKTFPMKIGDKLIFRDRFNRVTSVHEVTFVHDHGKFENVATTEVKDR